MEVSFHLVGITEKCKGRLELDLWGGPLRDSRGTQPQRMADGLCRYRHFGTQDGGLPESRAISAQ